jgi:hypothetical protein
LRAISNRLQVNFTKIEEEEEGKNASIRLVLINKWRLLEDHIFFSRLYGLNHRMKGDAG